MQKSSEYLNNFYSDWYKKSAEQIKYEIEVCKQKSSVACDLLATTNIDSIDSILEVGCGFGTNLEETIKRTGASFGLGCDVSKVAIDSAKKHYESNSIKFLQNKSLDVKSIVSEIREIHDKPFDVTLLFDVLEHIPQPKAFIRELASISKTFLIILPLDNTVFHNYILPERMKKYPCSKHPDGHFWEFNVNNVHHFITSLGLTPIMFYFGKLSINCMYPHHYRPSNLKGRLGVNCLKAFKYIAAKMLPTRIFLRLVGPGRFVCLADWSSKFVLD